MAIRISALKIVLATAVGVWPSVFAPAPLSAEDWSPLWTTATLPQTREQYAAASVAGKVMFGGGFYNINTVDIYDTSSGVWSLAHLTDGRDELAAAAAGGKLVFAGGQHGNPYSLSSVVDIYDAASNTWSAATLSHARGALAATSLDNKIYIGGGLDPYNPDFGKTVDIYDTAHNAWSVAYLSQPRARLAAAAAAGKVLFAGGTIGASGELSNRVDVHNTASNAWSTASLSQARCEIAAASANGKVLFAGGFLDGGLGSQVVDIYHATSGQWSVATLSQPRAMLAATAVGNKILFAGGVSDSARSDAVDIYDAATGTWTVATLSTPRYNFAAATVGNKAFFAGGNSNTSDSAVIDIYTLQDYAAITSAKFWSLADRTNVNGRMQLNAGAILTLGTYDLTVGSMSGVAPINLGAKTLTAGSDNTDALYSGAIGGNGALVKTGAGVLTLTGANNYTGPTVVDAGSLLVNGLGSLAGPVTVNGGGTLGGNGRVGSVTVNAGGHVAPGASASTLTLTGNLTLASGARLDFELAGPAASDRIAMASSALILNGQQFSDFTFTPQAGFGPGQYTLVDAGTITGSLGSNRDGTIGGLPATLSASGGDLVLNVVPEPSAFVLLGMGALGLLGFAWRRRKRAAVRSLTAVLCAALTSAFPAGQAEAAFVSGVEAFDGTVLDTTTWEVYGDVTQNDALLLRSRSDYTTRAPMVGIGDKVRVDLTLGSSSSASVYLTSNSRGTADLSFNDSAYFLMNLTRSGFGVGWSGNGSGATWPIPGFSTGDDNKTFTIELQRTGPTSVRGAVYAGSTLYGQKYVSCYGISPAMPDNLSISLVSLFNFAGYTGLARFDNVVFTAAGTRFPPGTVDQQFAVIPGYWRQSIVSSSQSVAQVFTAAKTGTLTRVDLQLSRNDIEPSKGVRVEIWPTVNGVPSTDIGQPLATALIPASSTVPLFSEFIMADLTAANLHVQSGDKLAIVARSDANVTHSGYVDPYSWGCWDPTYSGGGGFVRNGASWILASSDFGFRTYVADVPEPSTFVLLGMGAFGLLGFAWRRRKRA